VTDSDEYDLFGVPAAIAARAELELKALA